MNESTASIKVGDRFDVTIFSEEEIPDVNQNFIGMHSVLAQAIVETIANKGGSVQRQGVSGGITLDGVVSVSLANPNETFTRSRSRYIVTATPTEPVFPDDFGGVAGESYFAAGNVEGSVILNGPSGISNNFAAAGVFLTLAIIAAVTAIIASTNQMIVSFNAREVQDRRMTFVENALSAGVPFDEAVAAALGLGTDADTLDKIQKVVIGVALVAVAFALLRSTKTTN